MQIAFPLENQCSPIRGIAEEPDEDQAMASASSSVASSTKSSSALGKKSTGSVASESTAARRNRPMPDMSAFDTAASSRLDRSNDMDSPESRSPIKTAPKKVCPPTPVRTPAWANEANKNTRKNIPGFHRQNSLITTKVLLSVPTQVVQGRCSLESSVLDEESNGDQVSRRMSIQSARSSSTPERAGSAGASDAGKTPLQLRGPPPMLPRFSSSGDLGQVVSFANDFDVITVLGSGAFADVYKVRSRRDNKLYAVKKNRRQFRGKRDRDMALAEVKAMQRLQSVCLETASSEEDHGKDSYSLYLLFFFRAWQEDGYFLCQTELCCRDTCQQLIESLRFDWNSAKVRYPSLLRHMEELGENSSEVEENQSRLVPNLTVWKICHDVLAGLSHIHSHGLVHHDIKPSNIFFVEHSRFGAMCKIGDFGMAGDIGTTADGQEGDTKYMPQELLASGERQPSADIFSLGLTLFEISTDENFEVPSSGPLWHELRSDNIPELPKSREPELTGIIKAMTCVDDKKRPSADALLKNEKVRVAGHACDTFLRDYIRDITEYDSFQEQRLAMMTTTEDQTPQTVPRGLIGARSPSLSMMIPSVPSLSMMSPSAPASAPSSQEMM